MQAVMRVTPMHSTLPVSGASVNPSGRVPPSPRGAVEDLGLKEETHAARWGLLRGYSGKATKWVDFVVTDSTRRESCHVS